MQINAGTMRALEAFQEAVLMVDTTNSECWTVLHVNKTFLEQTGSIHSNLVDACFVSLGRERENSEGSVKHLC